MVGNGKQDGQEVPKHQDGDDHDKEEDEMSSSEADKQKEENKDNTAPLVTHAPVTESLPPIVIEEMEEMFFKLVFSQTVVMNLVDDQGIDFPWCDSKAW